jgi:hypothetical protein
LFSTRFSGEIARRKWGPVAEVPEVGLGREPKEEDDTDEVVLMISGDYDHRRLRPKKKNFPVKTEALEPIGKVKKRKAVSGITQRHQITHMPVKTEALEPIGKVKK